MLMKNSGDRVGSGYNKSGCMRCKMCKLGYTYQCVEDGPGKRVFAQTDKDQGTLSTHSLWPAQLLFKIPDAIPNNIAGPLMCAGVTTFVPLYRNKFLPGSRVGVVGMGGLGHLAIQMAAKWCCTVIVFSNTDNKKDDALNLGASEFYTTNNLAATPIEPIDHLLVCTSVQPDWNL